MWWGPTFAYYGAKAACGNKAGCENITPEGIAYKFGIVMTLENLLLKPAGALVEDGEELTGETLDLIDVSILVHIRVPGSTL